ncbi:MAG: hypothetical protein IJM30_00850 [Thermoguttaceae bacterium]|nr:hypothetical protein [Thermoguttaceae bacterium]
MTAPKRPFFLAIFSFATFLLATSAALGFEFRRPWFALRGQAASARNAAPAPTEGALRVPDRYAAPPQAETPIELAPSFSARLPYSATLGRVVCEADFPLDSILDVQAEIAQLQRDLVDFLGVPEAREKIELCLFKDMNSYRAFISETFPSAPNDRPALYVKERGVGVLMIPRDSRMVLNIRHEMTHAYLNASLRNVPIWIDEGLAKYFEIPPGERGFRNPYLEKAEQNVSGLFGAPPSLSRLEKLSEVSQMQSREYRESWSWVHYMIHYSPRTQRVLSLYLKSLRPESQRGISQEDAKKLQRNTPLKKALEEFEPNYRREYVEHFKNWANQEANYERRRAEGARDAERAQESPSPVSVGGER